MNSIRLIAAVLLFAMILFAPAALQAPGHIICGGKYPYYCPGPGVCVEDPVMCDPYDPPDDPALPPGDDPPGDDPCPAWPGPGCPPDPCVGDCEDNPIAGKYEPEVLVTQDQRDVVFTAEEDFEDGDVESIEWELYKNNELYGEYSGKKVYNKLSRGSFEVSLNITYVDNSHDYGSQSFIWHHFMGPQADREVTPDPEWEWGFLEKTNQCIYQGDPVDEGIRIDLGDYEDSQWSKDKEICVNVQPSAGAQWYDLDSLPAISYINTEEGNYRWEQHCYSGSWSKGEPLPGCEDNHDIGFLIPFYGPYKEGKVDDDYDPTATENRSDGTSNGEADINLYAVHNRIQDDSDQGQGLGLNDVNDSTPNDEKLFRWSYTPNLTYAVDTTGLAYPPGTCYPRYKDNRIRTSITDKSINKSHKAFANSYASIENGDGTWKDPDDVNELDFNCDITGPDLGNGLDTGGGTTVDQTGNGVEVEGSIIFDQMSEPGADMQKPVCGDDMDEYLASELGQSENGDWYKGQLYCIPEPVDNKCLIETSTGIKLRDLGTVENRNEPGEQHGRLKKDREVCQKTPETGVALWLDQDFSRKTCRENSFYGEDGVRWINAQQVQKNPHAFTQGIDDSGDTAIQKIIEDAKTWEKYTSLQGEVPATGITDGETPVPTGKDVNEPDLVTDWTASQGFCLGDDTGETVVTQRSRTPLIETDTSVHGASLARTRKACVLDHSQVNINTQPGLEDKHVLYQTGETVEIRGEKAACFDGTWYGSWPVQWGRDQVKVEKGETITVPFHIINIREKTTEYEIELYGDNKAEQFSSFTHTDSDTFTAQVEGQSIQNHQVEIYGGDTRINGEKLTIQGIEIDGDIDGEETMYVHIDNPKTGASQQQTRSVPGIEVWQLIVLVMVSALVYFRRS